MQRDYQYHIIAPQDLQEFTELKPTSIKARQLVPYRAPWNLLVWGVRNMWGDVHESYESADPSDPDCEKAVPVLQVFGCVVIRRVNEKAVIVEWESDPMSDVVSDSVTAVILRMESCPASVKGMKSIPLLVDYVPLLNIFHMIQPLPFRVHMHITNQNPTIILPN